MRRSKNEVIYQRGRVAPVIGATPPLPMHEHPGAICQAAMGGVERVTRG